MPFSDTVKRVIELATAIRDYWDAELPKRYSKYPLVQPGEEDGPPPPEEAELRDLLRSLPPDDVYKLLAISRLWWGRIPVPDFPTRWRTVVEDEAARYDLDATISGMAEYSSVAEDLAEGVQLLSAAGIDLDAAQPAAA